MPSYGSAVYTYRLGGRYGHKSASCPYGIGSKNQLGAKPHNRRPIMAKKNENTTTAMAIAEAVAFAKSAMSDGKKPTNAEVEEARKNASFAAAVDAVAVKFGNTEKGARNRASFLTISDEEWKLLPFAIREWKSGRWPYINGHLTHPMTSILTREEAENYYKTQEENEGKGKATGPRSKVSIEDEVASINSVKAFIADIKAMEEAGLNEAAHRMMEYAPALNAPAFQAIFNGSSMDVLNGKKVSLSYLLCRRGEERPDSMVSMAEAMAQGFFPMVSKGELDSQLEKFKSAGLDCADFIALI